jgi:hypothetical protein
MPDKSTPSPSDPENPESGSSKTPKESTPANKLRLKRVVIEETEINPSKDKEWEPAPESRPFEEPVEEPVPVLPIPLTPEQIGELPPEQVPVSFDEDDDEEDDEEEEDDKVPQKKQLSPAARLAVILVPAAIICAAMILFIRTYDPFGDGMGRIAPTNIPAELLKPHKDSAESSKKEDGGLAGTSLEKPRTSLQGFLAALQEQPLTASINPRGVFIDSVFIPEGAALNQQIGVVFSSLIIENNKALIVVTSPDGKKLTLPADVSLK